MLEDLTDEELKGLADEFGVPITQPWDRNRQIELMSGECVDCKEKKAPPVFKFAVVYDGVQVNKTAGINRSSTKPEEKCLGCEKKKRGF